MSDIANKMEAETSAGSSGINNPQPWGFGGEFFSSPWSPEEIDMPHPWNLVPGEGGLFSWNLDGNEEDTSRPRSSGSFVDVINPEGSRAAAEVAKPLSFGVAEHVPQPSTSAADAEVENLWNSREGAVETKPCSSRIDDEVPQSSGSESDAEVENVWISREGAVETKPCSSEIGDEESQSSGSESDAEMLNPWSSGAADEVPKSWISGAVADMPNSKDSETGEVTKPRSSRTDAYGIEPRISSTDKKARTEHKTNLIALMKHTRHLKKTFKRVGVGLESIATVFQLFANYVPSFGTRASFYWSFLKDNASFPTLMGNFLKYVTDLETTSPFSKKSFELASNIVCLSLDIILNMFTLSKTVLKELKFSALDEKYLGILGIEQMKKELLRCLRQIKKLARELRLGYDKYVDIHCRITKKDLNFKRTREIE